MAAALDDLVLDDDDPRPPFCPLARHLNRCLPWASIRGPAFASGEQSWHRMPAYARDPPGFLGREARLDPLGGTRGHMTEKVNRLLIPPAGSRVFSTRASSAVSWTQRRPARARKSPIRSCRSRLSCSPRRSSKIAAEITDRVDVGQPRGQRRSRQHVDATARTATSCHKIPPWSENAASTHKLSCRYPAIAMPRRHRRRFPPESRTVPDPVGQLPESDDRQRAEHVRHDVSSPACVLSFPGLSESAAGTAPGPRPTCDAGEDRREQQHLHVAHGAEDRVRAHGFHRVPFAGEFVFSHDFSASVSQEASDGRSSGTKSRKRRSGCRHALADEHPLPPCRPSTPSIAAERRQRAADGGGQRQAGEEPARRGPVALRNQRWK